MPAQKRRLPSPSSKPRDHVAAPGSDAATAAGGGAGEGRGGRPPLPSGGAAKRRLTEPKPQRGLEDGELDDGIEAALPRPSLSRCACRLLYLPADMAKRLGCASMGLADSDAEDGGAADGDSESSQSDGGGGYDE